MDDAIRTALHHSQVIDLTTTGRRTGQQRRIEDLVRHGCPVDIQPTCYVCGPTSFAQAVASLLLVTGHHAARIRTERFGGA